MVKRRRLVDTEMLTVTITRGLPGCGKSLAARRLGVPRVCRDDLRAMLLLPWPYGDSAAEDLCTVAEHALIGALLGAGHSVVVDATNLPDEVVAGLAQAHGAVVRVLDLRDVPLETCLERNAQRPGADRVPEVVIRAMHERYIARTGGSARG